jgi:ubiquinone/menaquinone biosynthesis C-methylase UbiE
MNMPLTEARAGAGSDAGRDAAADQALKAKLRAVWASGDYAAVARKAIPELGGIVAAAARVGPGDRVLDVAAGSGNASLPAARAGASVAALDLTPELLEAGRREAERAGLTIRFDEGDAEAMPYADNSFDAVISCVGVMFAPHHAPAARELTRVTRPGGRLALITWTPDGFIGKLLAAVTPFLPAPPPGVQPALKWGDPDYVRELLGDGVTQVETSRRMLPVDRFRTPEEVRDLFRDLYGPTMGAYVAVRDDVARTAELDRAIVSLAAAAMDSGRMEWEYLLITAVAR